MVIRSIVLITALAILFSACTPVRNVSLVRTEEIKEVEPDVQVISSPEAYSNYLEGFMEEQDGNLNEALKKYETALSFDENSLFLLTRVATLHAK